MKKTYRAFSLIELSIVILIIGVLVAGVSQGLNLVRRAKLSSARQLTQSSVVSSIRGLSLWFETTVNDSSFLISEASDGSQVSTWFDINNQSGSVNNATQNNATNRPIYLESAINGLPALNFNGTSHHLSLTTPSAFIEPGSSAMTTFFVASAARNSTSHGVVLRVEGQSSVSIGLGFAGSAVRCGRYYSSGTSTGSWTPTNAPNVSFESAAICVSRYNGSQIQGWTNGSSLDNVNTMTGFLSRPLGAVNIGGIANNEYLRGNIGEIIVFNRALSQEDIDEVESYLAKKWGIKIN